MAEIKQSFMLEDVDIEIGGVTVGSIQSLTVELAQENKPLGGNASKKPREIMRGPMRYTGTVEDLFLDVDTIKSLVDLENGDNPYFDLVGVTRNKNPERRVSIRDAVFRGLSLNFALGEETKTSQDFDALDLDVK